MQGIDSKHGSKCSSSSTSPVETKSSAPTPVVDRLVLVARHTSPQGEALTTRQCSPIGVHVASLPPDVAQWLCENHPDLLAKDQVVGTMAAIAGNPAFTSEQVRSALHALATIHAENVLPALKSSNPSAPVVDHQELQVLVAGLHQQRAAGALTAQAAKLLVDALVHRYTELGVLRMTMASFRALRDLCVDIARDPPAPVDSSVDAKAGAKAGMQSPRPQVLPAAALSSFYSQVLDVPAIQALIADPLGTSLDRRTCEDLWLIVRYEMGDSGPAAFHAAREEPSSGAPGNPVAVRMLKPLDDALDWLLSRLPVDVDHVADESEPELEIEPEPEEPSIDRSEPEFEPELELEHSEPEIEADEPDEPEPEPPALIAARPGGGERRDAKDVEGDRRVKG